MDSGKGQQNYWPGFVDALSNVVLTLVFVLVVFVFALAMISSQIEKKVGEIRQEHAEQQRTETTNAELEAKLRLAEARIAQLEKSTPPPAESALKEDVTIKVDKTNDEVATSADGVDLKAGIIIIAFPTGGIALTKQAQDDLVKALAPYRTKLDGAPIHITSVMGMETVSEAKRLAYYRLLGVRNFLIESGLARVEKVKTVIAPASKQGANARVEIRFGQAA